MPKRNLFYDRFPELIPDLPEPFCRYPDQIRSTNPSSLSTYSNVGRSGGNAISSGVLYPVIIQALLEYCNIQLAPSDHSWAIGKSVKAGQQAYVAETMDVLGNLFCVAGEVTTTSPKEVYFSVHGSEVYRIGDNYYGVELVFAVLPLLLQNREANVLFERFKTFYRRYCMEHSLDVNDNGAYEWVAIGASLCENFVSRSTRAQACNDQEPGSGLILMVNLPVPDLNTDDFSVTENFSPKNFEVFNVDSNVTVHVTPEIKSVHAKEVLEKEWNVEDLANAFVRDKNRQLSVAEAEEVEHLKQKLGPWYCVPRQLLKAAIAAKETYGSVLQFQNFYFYGEAGGGKSSAAMALALALGIPYRALTFSANTEIMDVLQSISPVTVDADGKSHEVAELASELPSAEDISFDPVGAYEKITGIHKEDVQQEEVTTALFQKVSERMNSSGQRFKYVDSPLAEAFRYGYLCELQEPNIVANPGVIVGINGLLDRTATMVCSSGEIVHRHKDFVAVDSSNRCYSGCRDVNASHLSRFQMAMRFDKPSKDEQIDRIMKNTGCQNREVLGKMVDVCEAMCDILRKSGDDNYSCGLRELCSWAAWYDIIGDPMESAMDTIIPLATQNDDLMDHLKDCLGVVF